MENKSMSIAQVVAITGLPASTIRYYDQQLGEYLGIKRGKGRRRNFSQRSIELLQQAHGWMKNEGLSLRQARERLSQTAGANETAGIKPDPRLLNLSSEVNSLRRELDELKDIQQRTLEILSSITR